MTTAGVLVGILALATLVGAVVAALRGRGLLRKAPIVAMALLLTLVNGVFLLTAEGVLTIEAGRAPAVASAVMVHPLLLLSVLAVLGVSWFRDPRVWLLLLGVGGALAYSAVSTGLAVGGLFEAFPHNYALATFLGLAAALSAAAFFQTSLVQKEGVLSLVATVALVASGPIYAFELQALGFEEALDANLGAPLAVVPMVYALMVGNPLAAPLPPVVRSVTRRRYRVRAGGLVLLHERRPKYAYSMAREQYHCGGPTMVVTAEPEGRGGRVLSGVPRLTLGIGNGEVRPWRLSRVANTVSGFLHRSNGGTVLFDGLDYVFTHNPRAAVLEMVARIGLAASASGGTVLFPLCRLLPEERQAMESMALSAHDMPNVEDEVNRILRDTVGGAGAHIVKGFCSRQRIRPEDLSVEDIPGLVDAVRGSIQDFAEGPVEDHIRLGWESQADSLATMLMAYREASLKALETSRWREVQVKDVPEQDLTGPIREVFAQHMGDAGTRLFETQLKKMNGTKGLRPSDIPVLMKGIEDALAAMRDAIDVDSAKSDLVTRAARIETDIRRMAEVST